MVTLSPVIDPDEGYIRPPQPPWSARPRPWRRVGVADVTAAEDLGIVVASLRPTSDWLTDRPETSLRRLLDHRPWFLDGGLVLEDGTASVVPGCCADLHSWGEWWSLLAEPSYPPWCGHSPDPFFEPVAGGWRVWQDEDDRTEPFIELPRTELPQLLRSVRVELESLVVRVEAWVATLVDPRLAARVAEALDEDLVAADRR